MKRHGRSSRRRRETENYGRTGCKQTVAGRMTQRIRCESRCFDCGGGSDRRLLGRVFSHQQMAMEPPNVTVTVFKKRKEKQTSLRKILDKQFGRSRPRRLPPTLADLMRRAKPLKKASHLPPPPHAHTPTSTIPIGRVLRRSPSAAACFRNQNAHQVIPEGQNVQ